VFGDIFGVWQSAGRLCQISFLTATLAVLNLFDSSPRNSFGAKYCEAEIHHQRFAGQVVNSDEEHRHHVFNNAALDLIDDHSPDR